MACRSLRAASACAEISVGGTAVMLVAVAGGAFVGAWLGEVAFNRAHKSENAASRTGRSILGEAPIVAEGRNRSQFPLGSAGCANRD